MNPVALAAELDREPFIPLRLHLADGRTLDVNHPGLCHIAHLALYLFRVKKPASVLAQDVEMIALRNIVSVETGESPRAM
jgi:hypothetical protein